MKSVVRFSQLMSQKNVRGINCDIQGSSTVSFVVWSGLELKHMEESFGNKRASAFPAESRSALG